MKTGWKLTIEATGIQPTDAWFHAKKAMEMANAWSRKPSDSTSSDLNGSATATWERTELVDVDAAENL